MASYSLKRTIQASPDVVFRAASDLRNAPQRIRGIVRVEVLTDGPIRQGTRFRETRMMFKREATEEMEVTSFDPPRGYAIGCDSCGCRYRSEFRFEPAGGGTDVTMTFEAQPLTFFAKVMGFVMRPMLKSCMRIVAQDLDDLKAAIESGQSAAGPSLPS